MPHYYFWSWSVGQCSFLAPELGASAFCIHDGLKQVLCMTMFNRDFAHKIAMSALPWVIVVL